MKILKTGTCLTFTGFASALEKESQTEMCAWSCFYLEELSEGRQTFLFQYILGKIQCSYIQSTYLVVERYVKFVSTFLLGGLEKRSAETEWDTARLHLCIFSVLLVSSEIRSWLLFRTEDVVQSLSFCCCNIWVPQIDTENHPWTVFSAT